MSHHKRGRPKNRRAGCLLCKPHKANGAKQGLSAGGARLNEDLRQAQREVTEYDHAQECAERRLRESE